MIKLCKISTWLETGINKFGNLFNSGEIYFQTFQIVPNNVLSHRFQNKFDNMETRLFYKHCYNHKLVTVKIIKAVACTINMIVVVIDDSINQIRSQMLHSEWHSNSRVVNYDGNMSVIQGHRSYPICFISINYSQYFRYTICRLVQLLFSG